MVDATGAFNHGVFTTNGSEVMHVIMRGLRYIVSPVAQIMWVCHAEGYRQQKKRDKIVAEREERGLGGTGYTGGVPRGDQTATTYVEGLFIETCRASRHACPDMHGTARGADTHQGGGGGAHTPTPTCETHKNQPKVLESGP